MKIETLNRTPSTRSNLLRGALFAAVTALAIGGCDEASEPEQDQAAIEIDGASAPAAAPVDDRAANVESDASVLDCDCTSAFFSCPTDSETFEYWQPACPGESYQQARALCEAHCPATCVNLGWTNWC